VTQGVQCGKGEEKPIVTETWSAKFYDDGLMKVTEVSIPESE